MGVSRVSWKYMISQYYSLLSLRRRFVSATIPSHKRVDKETCEKVIDAAEAVKDGTKQVVSAGKAVTEKAANATGTVTADLAKKGFEQAADSATTENGKDFFHNAKTAAEALKDKIDKKL